MKTLVVDNIDSFTYNLVQYVGMLGGQPLVIDNKTSISEVEELAEEQGIERIIVSPGPRAPLEAGVSNEVIKVLGKKIPILGVCLGHQCIGHVFGAKIRGARDLRHGKTSEVEHDGRGIFSGIKNPLRATRYHSLAVDEQTLPSCLAVSARSRGDGEIMGLQHTRYPIQGLQFHPESILTEEGFKIIKNFLYNEKCRS